LSAAELKTMSFEQVQGRLTTLFGGAAAANANTYAGQIARVQVAFNEAKETVGTALLPILDKLLGFINENALPAITAFSNAFSLTEGDGFGKIVSDVGTTLKVTFTPIIEGVKKIFDNVKTAVMNSKDEFSAFWNVVKFIAPLIGKAIGGALSVIGDIAEILITVFAKVLGAIKPLINTAIDGINLVIRGLNIINPGTDIKYLPKIGDGSTTTGPLGNFSMSTGGVQTTPTGTTTVTPTGTTTVTPTGTTTATNSAAVITNAAIVTKKAGDIVTDIAGAFDNFTSGTTTLAGIMAASNQPFAFGTSGVNTNTLAGIMAASAQPAVVINVNAPSIIDEEGFTRAINNAQNNSFFRGTGGATNLVGI
jgi:hypothetical protein